ncbi:MAG: CDP-diacylglycerol--serine O-phosphatidyltransferase [Deltaproteobacteria bacterium]|nr:CDP-diacylglycerol--serine O-phosphatidyltransferase [Deltaproteobacteria bacterium]
MPFPGRYVLPNLVTCASLSVGLLSIGEAIAGRLGSSAWFILLCVLLDKADGTVARLFNASSKFGTELDSLSDVVTFGVAPAVLMLTAVLGPSAPTLPVSATLLKTLAYAGGLAFPVGAALRLAKFNVMTGEYGKEFFFGIPTTHSGALVATLFLTGEKYGVPWQHRLAMPILMLVLALLMVSRLPLPKLVKRRSLAINVVMGVNITAVYLCGLTRLFPEYLLGLATCYYLFGTGWALTQGVKAPRMQLSGDPPPPE